MKQNKVLVRPLNMPKYTCYDEQQFVESVRFSNGFAIDVYKGFIENTYDLRYGDKQHQLVKGIRVGQLIAYYAIVHLNATARPEVWE